MEKLPITFEVEGATILDAMAAIGHGAASLAVAVDQDGRLIGVVTDGDLRRVIVGGRGLDSPVADVLRKDPVVAHQGESRSVVLDLMRARGIDQVPVVDSNGRVMGIHLLREFVGHDPRGNAALIMAGGKGRRLGSITATIPKPMVPVAGRPILERLIAHLVGFGITQIGVSVGHLADVILDHFGDGSDYGCSIRYFREEPDLPLGTAGSLPHLLNLFPESDFPALILNGDLVTQFDVAEILNAHVESNAEATVGGFAYRQEIPFGVLTVGSERLISDIAEKPTHQEWVSGGIYVFQPERIRQISGYTPLDMPEYIKSLIRDGAKVQMWPIDQEWIDVGRPRDLAKAQGYS